ncbi:MAG: ATP-binding protein [Candidatus Bathyarchaeia archaeon]
MTRSMKFPSFLNHESDLKVSEDELITTSSRILQEFFTLNGLKMRMGGCDPENIPALCLKELVDNALDASPGNEIIVDLRRPNTITVRDNGPGISRETMYSILDYNNLTSSKRLYIRPTRGALGNALPSIFAAPYVLARADNVELKEPWIKVRSRGVEYSIGFRIDWQNHKVEPLKEERKIDWDRGTEISITFHEEIPKRILVLLLIGYALFNPDSRIILKLNEEEEWLLSYGKARLKPKHSNIYYYDREDFRNLFLAKVKDGTAPCELIKLFISNPIKIQEVIHDVWGENPPERLSDEQSQIERLLLSLRRVSPSPSPKDLGRIGGRKIKKFLNLLYIFGKVKEFWYDVVEELLTDDFKKIPYVIEVGLALLEEGEKGAIFVGFNNSPCIDIDSFLSYGIEQEWIDRKGTRKPGLSKKEKAEKSDNIAVPYGVLKEYGFNRLDPDAILVIHVSCPILKYSDYGKSHLNLDDQVMKFIMKDIGRGLIHVFSDYYKFKRTLLKRSFKLSLSGEKLAETLLDLQSQIGFKLSSRGWCYMLESKGLIDKGQFDKIEKEINRCRKEGLLPIDFVAEDEGRIFIGDKVPNRDPPEIFLVKRLEEAMAAEKDYTLDWWEGEKYYLMMLVEKIDIRTLFEPVCKKYHVPIATSKGWSSLSQRAWIAERFKWAEERGLIPVLLYFGDHDPWGLEISNALKKNLEEVSRAWGWEPKNLIIDRFGLNYDQIEKLGLTWIDNLTTSSGKNADPKNSIVRRYKEKYGERKCESNALVVRPKEAELICREAVEKYLGPDAKERFAAKAEPYRSRFKEFKDRTNLEEFMEDLRRKAYEGSRNEPDT